MPIVRVAKSKWQQKIQLLQMVLLGTLIFCQSKNKPLQSQMTILIHSEEFQLFASNYGRLDSFCLWHLSNKTGAFICRFHGIYTLEVSRDQIPGLQGINPMLLRANIKSPHSSGKRYFVFIVTEVGYMKLYRTGIYTNRRKNFGYGKRSYGRQKVEFLKKMILSHFSMVSYQYTWKRDNVNFREE
ncbi:unnamed protein product [Leptidea sinapis]|uniref:Uncharacterized protein n=1 Tax=Leptidea sinapis TaxID=189913 RepID=A0A5E4QFR0_9NEOP|nr:unnamed protein product [Leptidea sinapis]